MHSLQTTIFDMLIPTGKDTCEVELTIEYKVYRGLKTRVISVVTDYFYNFSKKRK